MNRLARMLLTNIIPFPKAYWKLCHYARHPEKYDEKFMFEHISYIMRLAVKGGNVDLKIFGQENIPTDNGFMMYANHQGLFDVVVCEFFDVCENRFI